jgi:tRNA dimethylallyltransferase
MAGGTGLYIKAFCEGLDDMPAVDEMIRAEINEAYKKNGIIWLKEQLKIKDRMYFSSGEMENPQRMLRALGVKLSTGRSVINYRSGKKAKRDFKIKNINLDIPRHILYDRINKRVDEMMGAGLLREAASLFSYRHLNALQTVGYKELFEHIEGRISLDEAVDLIKKNTRNFAKRQVTWFRVRA